MRLYEIKTQDFSFISGQDDIIDSLKYFYFDMDGKSKKKSMGKVKDGVVHAVDLPNISRWYLVVNRQPVAYIAFEKVKDGIKIGNARALKGYGYPFYVFLIEKFGKMYSDKQQTSAAKGLWNKFSKDPSLQVYVLDKTTGKSEKVRSGQNQVSGRMTKVYDMPGKRSDIVLFVTKK